MITFQSGDTVRIMSGKYFGKEGVITKIFFKRDKLKKRRTTHACVRFNDKWPSIMGPRINIKHLEMIKMRENGKHHRISKARKK